MCLEISLLASVQGGLVKLNLITVEISTKVKGGVIEGEREEDVM